MKKLLVLGALVLIIVAVPAVVFGQNTNLSNLNQLARAIGDIIEILIPIAAALALLYFFWGLAQFILAAGDEEKRKAGKKIMLWGIVALFVIASIWGIVNFITDSFGINNPSGAQQVPTFQIP